MIVELDLRGGAVGVRLVDPDDFGSFKVVVLDDAPALGARIAGAGVRLQEHAWVPVDVLRDLAGPAATPEWEASLTGMLEFARSRGWVDEHGAVRAHVEHAGV